MVAPVYAKGQTNLKAFFTQPQAVGAIELGERHRPVAESNQVLVRVTHFSLNRGELNFARTGTAGRPLGWDVAGVVEEPARSGQGPGVGARVVGFSRASQGWAEWVALDTRDVAVIPPGVDSAVAASLPVAALTALYALERGERLLGSRVLVTGASGGVGGFAVTLGALMGAQVVAQLRSASQVEATKALGASQVVVDELGDETAAAGPFRLIVDGLGNELTGRALQALSPDGIAVLYGVTAGQHLTVSPGLMLATGTGRIEGFNLFRQSEIESVSRGLDRLLGLVARGQMAVTIEEQAGWNEAPAVAQRLLDRKFSGKAVLFL